MSTASFYHGAVKKKKGKRSGRMEEGRVKVMSSFATSKKEDLGIVGTVERRLRREWEWSTIRKHENHLVYSTVILGTPVPSQRQ